MHKILAAVSALGVFALAVLSSGCTRATYGIAGQDFYSRQEAEQELTKQLDQLASEISPISSPIGGRALFALPTLEYINENAVVVEGDKKRLIPDQVDYVASVTLSRFKNMFSLLQRRHIFDAVDFTYNNDPQFMSYGNYDYFIYPSPDLKKWYFKFKDAFIAQTFSINTDLSDTYSRALSWLDSIESLAKASPPRRESSADLDVRLPAAPRETLNIAVAELRALAPSAAEVATLSERLRDTLSEKGFFTVMSGSDMEAALRARRFQRTGACDDARCLMEMGKILGMTKMVGGSIGKVGRMFSISLRLVDAKSGKVDAPASLDISAEPEELLKAIRNAGRSLVKNFLEKQ